MMRRIILLCVVIVNAAVLCAAQQRPQQAEESNRRITADETTYLNIVQRRITENDFTASTSVGFESEAKHVSMNVGVLLHAGKIDVSLRNVTGTVRFRGSVQRILDLINSRPVPPR